MSLNDPLANALSSILNLEKVGKDLAIIQPVSNLIKGVLTLMNENGYIGKATEVQDNKGNILKVNLLGRINKCGVIKPRFSVTLDTYDKFEKRYLPARNIGIMIVSTSQGLMTHTEAKKRNLGGKLVAYCY
jgi:small subunit ribosomal protein S8